jgi:hypothetical protein
MGDRTKPRTIGEVIEALGLGHNGNGALRRETVFVELRRLGVCEAQVDFSGGNGAGGVSEIRLVRPGGRIEKVSPYREYDERERRWVRRDGYPQALIEGLCKPIFRQYRDFAGDFYVQGTISWKVAEGMIEERSSEQVPQTEPIHREL